MGVSNSLTEELKQPYPDERFFYYTNKEETFSMEETKSVCIVDRYTGEIKIQIILFLKMEISLSQVKGEIVC